MTDQPPDERWDAMLEMLGSIASMDFTRSLEISDKADELDAVASGLNMLCEELAANVVQRSKLEEIVSQLEAANQELGAFSDALAHDLRSPLLIVTNFSHQLRETLGDSIGEQDADDLERIRFAGQHMMRIIDDLGDLGEVNRAEISRSEVDLSALGRHIMDDLRASVPNRNVKFEAEPGVTAVGDMTLLRILLRNLLQNAWKYTQSRHDARIEVGVVEDEGDLPIYHVRDNGIGFDNANNKVIFRAFERLHTRTDFTGSGLGLTTVDRIVRRHGGRVWAKGVQGEGAVFRFTVGSPSLNRRRGLRPLRVRPTTQDGVATRLPGEDRRPGAEADPIPAGSIHIEVEEPAEDLAPDDSSPPEDLPRDEPASVQPPVKAPYKYQLWFSTSKCEVETGSGRRCAKSGTHTRDGQLLCQLHADLQHGGKDLQWASADGRDGSSKCQSLTKAGKRCPKWAKFAEADRLYCPSHASDEIKAQKR